MFFISQTAWNISALLLIKSVFWIVFYQPNVLVLFWNGILQFKHAMEYSIDNDEGKKYIMQLVTDIFFHFSHFFICFSFALLNYCTTLEL